MEAALRGGRSEIVDRRLAAGADPDRDVEGDESPLFHAVRRGDVELVHWLLEAGALIDRVVPGDENALIRAAGAGLGCGVRGASLSPRRGTGSRPGPGAGRE